MRYAAGIPTVVTVDEHTRFTSLVPDYEGLQVFEANKPVTRDPQNFAVFKDYATGWLYLNNLLREKIKAHAEWTLLQLFENYAPAADNNDPTAYAAAVGKRLGVDYKTFVIRNIV